MEIFALEGKIHMPSGSNFCSHIYFVRSFVSSLNIHIHDRLHTFILSYVHEQQQHQQQQVKVKIKIRKSKEKFSFADFSLPRAFLFWQRICNLSYENNKIMNIFKYNMEFMLNILIWTEHTQSCCVFFHGQ